MGYILIDLLLLIYGVYRIILPMGYAFGGPKYVEKVNAVRASISASRESRNKVRFGLLWETAFDFAIICVGIGGVDLLCLLAGLVLISADIWRTVLYFHNNPLAATQPAASNNLTPPGT